MLTSFSTQRPQIVNEEDGPKRQVKGIFQNLEIRLNLIQRPFSNLTCNQREHFSWFERFLSNILSVDDSATECLCWALRLTFEYPGCSPVNRWQLFNFTDVSSLDDRFLMFSSKLFQGMAMCVKHVMLPGNICVELEV